MLPVLFLSPWHQAAGTHTAGPIQMSHAPSPQHPRVASGFNNGQTALPLTRQLEWAFTKWTRVCHVSLGGGGAVVLVSE